MSTARAFSAAPPSEETAPRPASGALEAVIGIPLGRGSEHHRPASLERVLGRSAIQRHLFHLAELGVNRCALVFSGRDADPAVQECRRQLREIPLGEMSVSFHHAADGQIALGLEDISGYVVLLRGDAIYDPRLYRLVRDSAGPVWVVDRSHHDRRDPDVNGPLPVGLAKIDAHSSPDFILDIGKDGEFHAATNITGCAEDRLLDVRALEPYLPDLRRHLEPYWCVLRTREDRRRAARLILDSAQKGVLDFPARFIHPVPENFLTRWASRTAITPNHITVFTGILAFAATYLFAKQAFGWGIAIALLVNVLDGVDGKLARVRLEASRFGDRLDHVLDVLFEFSWYVGLGWGLAHASGHRLPLLLGVGLIGVMVMSRAFSGVYKLLSGRQIHDHRAFDRAFRLVAGRRNIYIFVLAVGLITGNLEGSFYLVFGWGVTTVLVYSVRVLLARSTKAL